MSDEQKAQAVYELIVRETYPKDQLGFYTEEMLYNEILGIIKGY
jgi:hypothetical protein